jgi:hypothetical protein
MACFFMCENYIHTMGLIVLYYCNLKKIAFVCLIFYILVMVCMQFPLHQRCLCVFGVTDR